MVPLRRLLLLFAVSSVALLPVLARPAAAAPPASASGTPSASLSASPSPSAVLEPGPGAPPVVDVVKVDGVIDRPVADYLLATLEDAEGRGESA